MNPNETIESAATPEAKVEAPKPVEQTKESETELIQGAEMLESPQSGSFVHALQTFIAWVNNLLGK